MSNLQSVNEANFDAEVLKEARPVLVDFWAEWCGPCRALAPVLEEVANELGDSAKIVKVNVDENQGLATQYGIRGIPTLIYFKDGEAKSTLVGSQPKPEILKGLQSLI